jgi:hypothetical protein
MATFISPEGNPEVWDAKPEGYFTSEEWTAEHPPVEPPPPTEEELKEMRISEIKQQLASLDSQYLTPRVLAGLHSGDEYALASVATHKSLAAPLREKLATLA